MVAALLLIACAGTSPSSGTLEEASGDGPADGKASGKDQGRKEKRSRSDTSKKKAKIPKSPPAPVEDPEPRPRRHVVAVTDVVDGDTIEVARASGSDSVRLIGVDTPETVHPSVPVECYGPRASAFTAGSLLGENVRLEFDDERRDHYGRLLAYVWLGGKLFNKVLVARGFAEVTIYEPNDAYEDVLYSAQSRARSADLGAWGACSGGGGGGGAGSGKEKIASPGSGSKCDPNYEGACVPPYPPDIDCDDAGATNFRSTGTDPHGFDADGDGVACEG